MKYHRFIVLGACLAAAVAFPCAAQRTPETNPELALPMPNENELAALPFLRVASSKGETLETRLAALAKALDVANRPSAFRGFLRCQQAHLAFQEADSQTLYEQAVKECINLLPKHPAAQSMYAYYLLGKDLQGGEGLSEGVDILTRLLLKYPDIAAEGLERPLLNSVIRRLRYAGDQRRSTSLIDAYLASGIAKANDVATDSIVMMGLTALIEQKNWDGAKTLLRQLKTKRSVETLLVDLSAEPIWADAAQYYHGDLEQRRNLFDLDSWRSAGGTYGELTADRAAAMAELGEWDKLRVDADNLITKQSETYSWERDENFVAALSVLFRGGRSDLAIPLGRKYYATLGEKAEESLNGKLTVGHEMIKAGQIDEGQKLIEEGYVQWQSHPELTEGSGGQVFMDAVRSCAKATSDGEAAYKKVVAARQSVSGAYRAALECRGEVDNLTKYLIETLAKDPLADRLPAVIELRRIQAGQPERVSPALQKAIAAKEVAAALDKVSRSWSAATASKALGQANVSK